jgi:hypothetical protein
MRSLRWNHLPAPLDHLMTLIGRVLAAIRSGDALGRNKIEKKIAYE